LEYLDLARSQKEIYAPQMYGMSIVAFELALKKKKKPRPYGQIEQRTARNFLGNAGRERRCVGIGKLTLTK